MNLRDGSPESDSEVFLIGGKRRRIFIIVSFHLGKKHGKAGLGEQADEPATVQSGRCLQITEGGVSLPNESKRETIHEKENLFACIPMEAGVYITPPPRA